MFARRFIAALAALALALPAVAATPTFSPTGLTSPPASFVRPANTTAYAANQLVANSATAGSVVPLSWATLTRAPGECYRIERLTMTTSSTSLTNAAFNVLVFAAAPVVSVGDGAAFNSAGALSTAGVLSLKGSFAVTLSNSGSDGAWGVATPATGNGVTVCPAAGTTIYALIYATAAYTPTSGETITLYPEGYRP